MRISDWSSDVCSSDLHGDKGAIILGSSLDDEHAIFAASTEPVGQHAARRPCTDDEKVEFSRDGGTHASSITRSRRPDRCGNALVRPRQGVPVCIMESSGMAARLRSEEHREGKGCYST